MRHEVAYAGTITRRVVFTSLPIIALVLGVFWEIPMSQASTSAVVKNVVLVHGGALM